MQKEYAKYLLDKTIKDYNFIAEDYARTRGFTWDIEPLRQYVLSEERVLDLGCGNGRLIKILKGKNVNYIGVDASEKLIEIAKKNYPDSKFQTADAFDLPFPDNYFDKVFSIRVLHHFPSREFRLRFLEEAKRVLKPKGFLILTVWNVWGCKDKKYLWRLIESAFLKILGKSKLNFGDTFIPWGKKILRYQHYFTKNELKNLVEESGFKIKKIYTTSGTRQYSDIYVIAEK